MFNITLPKNRIIKPHSFLKLIEKLKEKDSGLRIRLDCDAVPQNEKFLKVLWSSESGMLIQDEHTKEFFAIENISEIRSFQINDVAYTFQPFKSYFLK